MKKITFLIIAAMVCGMSYGQLKVLSNGKVGLGVTNPIGDFQIGSKWVFQTTSKASEAKQMILTK